MLHTFKLLNTRKTSVDKSEISIESSFQDRLKSFNQGTVDNKYSIQLLAFNKQSKSIRTSLSKKFIDADMIHKHNHDDFSLCLDK